MRRQVNAAGLADFQATLDAGLYDELIAEEWLVPHRVGGAKDAPVITPEEIRPITYPFEWSFTMLQDAALLTLAAQKKSLERGLSLKDASAYNVQFQQGQPILIDTLSFEEYKGGEPWVAYGQFCRHFLAPLALMAYTDVRLGQLAREYLDGIPLDLAAKLLPSGTRLRPGLALHLYAHARSQVKKASEHKKPSRKVTKNSLLAIIDSLERLIKGLKPKDAQTEWKDYYTNTNYSDAAAKAKKKLVNQLAGKVKRLESLLDLGGNDGHYSQGLADGGVKVVCADIDPFAVEFNYRRVKREGEANMLPLLVDLTNPGGALGWENEEREPVHKRLAADMVMALALIHHLAISNNLPFSRIAEYFAQFAPYLLIEFVPKGDSQVTKLLSTRKDIFPEYTPEQFEKEFAAYYTEVEKRPIAGTKRTLYLFKRKQSGK